MKVLINCIFAIGLICFSAVTAAGQFSATITGPSKLTDAQPATVIWTVQQANNCQSGVRVVLTLNNTNIQIGNPVQLSARSNTVPGPIGVASGTPASLSLMDTCSGSIITSKFPITINGNAAAPPTAPAANPITPAVQQTIDSDCFAILGLACSTNPTYASTYSTITQRISQGSLGSDNNSIWSYLLTMVQSSAGWRANIVDNAWHAMGCGGQAPEAQWIGKYAQWQTYQSLYNQMHQAGCGGASANVAPAAPAPPAVQYLSQAQLQPAYNQVWGGATGLGGPIANTCTMPQSQAQIQAQAVSCARSALLAWVRAHGNGLLGANLVPTAYNLVFGVAINNATETSLLNSYGISWSGADDLATYLRSATYLQSITLGGLDQNGCLITKAGAKLSPNEQCNMYYLSSQGISTPTVYNIAFNGRMLQTKINNPFGLLVSNQGIPVRIVGPSAGTWQIQPGGYIVAAGGGNIILNGGGNIVAAGGGNIVAAGGGNIVAAGGGNIVAAGGGNVVNTNGSNLQVQTPQTAARTVGLISNNMSVISNDGGSFLPAITSLINQDGGSLQNVFTNGNFVGNNSSAITNAVTTNVIGVNGSAVTNAVNSNQISNASLSSTSFKVQSLGSSSAASNPVVTITGPARWIHGTAQVPVTWTVKNTGAPCNRGFQVYLQAGGNMADGSAEALAAGRSMVNNLSWPIGYRFNIVLWDLCTNQAVSAPFQTIIQ